MASNEFTYDLTRPVGMRRKLLDCTAVNEWGWEPTHTLEEGLQKTYDYFRSL